MPRDGFQEEAPREQMLQEDDAMGVLDDAILTGKVKAALLLDERIGATGINVNTVDGEVTLEGTVDSEIQCSLAEDIAVLKGAHSVRNLLDVTGNANSLTLGPIAEGAFGRVTTPPGAPPTDHADLEEEVRHALAADRRVNARLLDVRVENNTVFLAGRQGDVDAHHAAVETAAHVPGVVAVEDDVEIMPAV
jgi:hyperosmotically inducible protein